MSKRELARVEVLSRVRSEELRVVDAGRLMQVSYRQAKRLWKRYREEGAAGLQHRSAGRSSNHGHAKKFRQKVLGLVREKYGGAVGERFGPTLAAELHLQTILTQRRCAAGCWRRDYGVGSGEGGAIGGGGTARNILERWCRWTGAFTHGWRIVGRRDA